VLQDYNDIFKFVTVPNLFLTWYIMEYPNADEMDVTEDLKHQFLKTLKDIGIEIHLIIGAWSPQLSVSSHFVSPFSLTKFLYLGTSIDIRSSVIFRGDLFA
jgi:hypothetical protein